LFSTEQRVSLEEGRLIHSALQENKALLGDIRLQADKLEEGAHRMEPLQAPKDSLRFFMVELQTLDTKYTDMMDELSHEMVDKERHEALVNELSSRLDSLQTNVDAVMSSGDTGSLQRLLTQLNEMGALLQERTPKYIQPRDHVILSQRLNDINTQITSTIAADASKRQLNIPIIVENLDTGESAIDYDVDAAADVFAAIFRDRRPQDVLREHGFDDYDETGSSEFSSSDFGEPIAGPSHADDDSIISPIPDDPGPSTAGAQLQLQQRSRWKRILRTALPLQAMLVLLLGAACLVPHCDDDYCCHLLNNFARTLDPQLDFTNGPPPF